MSEDEWINILEAITWVFGPFIMWWFAGFTALGFVAGVNHLWQGFLRWFTKRS